jgi:hypothetical protein
MICGRISGMTQREKVLEIAESIKIPLCHPCKDMKIAFDYMNDLHKGMKSGNQAYSMMAIGVLLNTVSRLLEEAIEDEV